MKVGVASCMAGVGSTELASPISTSELFFSLGEEDILDRLASCEMLIRMSGKASA
ncbi:hypothetical protein DY000_02030533 [Brassica cretica]|uniref:Uncharacterized protein n=1 Tax=Brassica cretica TaxID=69181 RepID=A0ABQ7DY51_BRACR|nr:hypothetical protein DY000_02030533 [Brassica cretica]